MPHYKKNPDFPEKYPETQTRPKKPRSSGKNPTVVTLVTGQDRTSTAELRTVLLLMKTTNSNFVEL